MTKILVMDSAKKLNFFSAKQGISVDFTPRGDFFPFSCIPLRILQEVNSLVYSFLIDYLSN
jgi:hypothetical protein